MRYSFAAFEAAMEHEGGLAQLARALDLHSRGHRFDSGILHCVLRSFMRSRAEFMPSKFCKGVDTPSPRLRSTKESSLTYCSNTCVVFCFFKSEV